MFSVRGNSPVSGGLGSSLFDALRRGRARRSARKRARGRRHPVAMGPAAELLEERTLLSVAAPIPPGLTSAVDLITDALPAEIQDDIPTEIDSFLQNDTTLVYSGFPQETNDVTVSGNALNFFMLVNEQSDDVPVLRIPPAFNDNLIEDLEAGFSFVGELTFPIGSVFPLDLPGVDAIVPNPQAIASFFPVFDAVAEGIRGFLDLELIPDVEFGPFNFPEIEFPEIDIGVTTICEDGCTIVPEFTLIPHVEIIDAVTVRDILPDSVVGVLEDIAGFFDDENLAGGGVFMTLLDGSDTADLSRLSGASQVVFGGTGADTIIGGGGQHPLEALGVSPPFGFEQPTIQLFGNSGRDTFPFNPLFTSEHYEIDGGDGNDRILVQGSDGNDIYRVSRNEQGKLVISLEAPNPNDTGQDVAEVQTVTLPENTGGGTFRLGFGGQETGPIAFDAAGHDGIPDSPGPFTDVQSALESLDAFDPGDVAVTEDGDSWKIEFAGALSAGNPDVPALSVNGSNLIVGVGAGGVSVERVVQADPNVGVNRVQRIVLPEGTTGGTFDLTFEPDTTDNTVSDRFTVNDIPFNISSGDLEQLLIDAGAGAGNIRVSGPNEGPWLVEFIGDFQASNEAQIVSVDGSLLSGGVEITASQTRAAEPKVNQVQTVTIPDGATGGTFTLTFDGETTKQLPFDATTIDVEEALASLSAIGSTDNVEVRAASDASATYDIEFTGDFEGQTQPTVTADGSDLRGGIDATVGTDPQGSGVNEQQTIRANQPFELTFERLIDGTLVSRTTPELPADATAEEIETALAALTTVGGRENVIVSGDPGGPWTVEWTGRFAGEEVPALQINPAGTLGHPVDVTELQSGSNLQNEIQEVELPAGLTGGTFTLSYQGDQTDPIPYNADATTVASALQPVLGSISGVTGFAVFQTGSETYQIQISGGGDLDLLDADGANLFDGPNVRESQSHVAGDDEQQRITIPGATGGTFTLSFGGETSEALPFNATAAQVENALAALNTVGGTENIDVVRTVTSSTRIYDVTFTGRLAGTDVPAMSIDDSNLAGGFSIADADETQAAFAGVDEQQTIEIDADPSTSSLEAPDSGEFLLRFNSQFTDPIPHDADGGAVEDALEALPGIGSGNVDVSGGNSGPYVVTFQGDLGAENQPLIRAEADAVSSLGSVGLRRGIDLTFDAIQEGRGTNEVQRIQLPSGANGGTFTLSFADPQGHETELDGNIGDGTTTITVDDAAGFPATPFEIRIGGEHMRVTGVSGSTLTVQRGINGTDAVEHDDGALVQVIQTTDPIAHNAVGSDGDTNDTDSNGDFTDIKAALVALDAFDDDDLRVTGDEGGPWAVEFIGDYAEQSQELLDAQAIDITRSSLSANVQVVETRRGSISGENLVLASTTYDSVNSIEQLQFEGLAGDDVLIVDSSNGPINFPLGVNWDGGDGTDRLVLQGDSQNSAESSTYLTGPGEATGSSIIDFGDATQVVNFENLDPGLDAVIDRVPANSLTVEALDTDNAIDVRGSSFEGFSTSTVSVDTHAKFLFANKSDVTLNLGGGDDAVSLDTGGLAPGVTGVTVNGQGAAGGDAVLLLGTTSGNAFDYTATNVNDAQITMTGGRSLDIQFESIESAAINALGNDPDATGANSLTVHGTEGDDILVHTPGSETDAGSVQANSLLEVVYRNFGVGAVITLDGDGGTDQGVFSGTGADDILTLTGAGALVLESRAGRHEDVEPTDIESLRLAALEGDDRIVVDAANGGVAVTVEGSGPSGSDLLTVPGVLGVDEDLTVSHSQPLGTGNVAESVGGLDLDYAGVERLQIEANSADADALTLDGSAIDDRLVYRPGGPRAGTVRSEGINTVFEFSGLSSAFTITGGSDFGDEVAVEGTNNHDVITVDGPNRTAAVQNAAGEDLKPVTVDNAVELLSVRGRLGDDTILVVPAEGVGDFPLSNLLIGVDGGPPSASDALVVAGDTEGTPLDNEEHFAIVKRSRTEDEGKVRIFQDTPGEGNAPTQLPDVTYADVEVVEPLLDVDDTAQGEPNLLILGPDTYEGNEFRSTAAHAGSGKTLNVTDLSVFPDVAEHRFVDGDEDWFRFTAEETGTLDFQVTFREFDPELLPGGGTLDVEVYDEDGDPVGTGTVSDGKRIAVPVVRNETYYLRVLGADDSVVNGYDLTAINIPAPVPQLVDLQAGSDSGRSDTDDITNDTTPTFDIYLDDDRLQEFANLDLQPDEDFFVDVFRNGEFIGTAEFQEGSRWQFTAATGDLQEGHDNFLSAAVRIRDGAEPFVEGRGDLSDALQITLDTVAPPASITGIDPSTSDTGVDGYPETIADRITADTNTGFIGVAEADAIVRMWADGEPISDGTLGESDVFQGLTVAQPFDGDEAFPDGQWSLSGQFDLNDPEAGFPLDGLRQIGVTGEDLAGNQSEPTFFDVFIDTQGPRVTDVTITEAPEYDLFDVKPTDGPTPLIESLTLHVSDLPERVADFIYDALQQDVAEQPGHYRLVGDRVGKVAISGVTVVQSASEEDPASATIRLDFAEPLQDDRYTLRLADSLVDPAGNALDGESNAAEPNGDPSFASGDGVPGGDFLARFTVDSRPEIGTWGQAGVFVDANGNFVFDPAVSGGTFHDVSRDLAFEFAIQSDQIFAGQFKHPGADSVNGFDRLGAYGLIDGRFRFLLDFNDNGRIDPGSGESFLSNRPINGLPVAGDFDGNPDNGEEIALFDGTAWHLDTTGNNRLDTTVTGNLRGLPIAGDFDGDGRVDLAAHRASGNRFAFSLSSRGGSLAGGNSSVNASFPFGFPGVLERPVAADFNQDGITDIGLTTPGQEGNEAQMEWSIVISDPVSPAAAPAAKFDALTRPFSPTPLGNDIFTVFGADRAAPVVGNFDPPGGTAQDVPDLAGSWTDNGVPASASIEQSGLSLTFTNRRGRTSSGHFLGPNEIVATDWGNLHAEIRDGLLVWDNGVIWAPPISAEDVPDLAGSWTDNGVPASAEIEQSGTTLTFTNRRGRTSSGHFLSPTEIVATDWGKLHAKIRDGRLMWDNGVVWAPPVSAEDVPDLSGSWIDDGSGTARIEQSGTTLTFTNRRGRTSSGHFLSPTEIVATDWGKLHAKIRDGRLMWDNGVVWAPPVSAEDVPDLSGSWIDDGSGTARIEQSGTTLTFTNRRGRTSSGHFLSPTEIVAADWGRLHAKIRDGRLVWDNGVVWTPPVSAEDVPDLSGSWTDDGHPGTAEIKQSGASLTLINRRGRSSSGYWLSPTEIVAADWGHLHGTVEESRILWDNGIVWEAFDVAALDELFANVDDPVVV